MTNYPAITLMPLAIDELNGLAQAKPAPRFAGAPDGALPPPHVAARALAQLETGMAAFWCVPFVMVDDLSGQFVGGCTFKGVPANGEVEIAYGVAQSARGRGVATAAVARLLELAAGSGVISRVVAEILPSNIASAKVVARLGFTDQGSFVDTDGETVTRWTYMIAKGYE